MTMLTIDLAGYNGPVYTGRERGQRIRAHFKLDEVDRAGTEVNVVVPPEAYTVTSSFFLGLFGPSVVSAGSKSAFFDRYHFKAPEFLRPEVEGYVARALHSRNLFA